MYNLRMRNIIKIYNYNLLPQNKYKYKYNGLPVASQMHIDQKHKNKQSL